MIFTKYMMLLTMIFMILMQNKNIEICDLYEMYDPSDYNFYEPNAK